MAALANSPALQDTLVYVFSEIPVALKQNCEICKKDLAAYRWTEKQGNVAKRNSIICRVCASMVVLVGKP